MGSGKTPRERKKSVQEVWDEAYRKALKQFGHRSQAERIAWAAVDGITPEALLRLREQALGVLPNDGVRRSLRAKRGRQEASQKDGQRVTQRVSRKRAA